MKKGSTASFQAYGPMSLRDFLVQDMQKNGFKSMSEEIIYALVEYAKSNGYQPERLSFENNNEIVDSVIDNPQLTQAILTRLLNSLKHSAKCLFCFT